MKNQIANIITIGPHFRNNPHGLDADVLVKHGEHILEDVPRSFEGIRDYLQGHYMEGNNI